MRDALVAPYQMLVALLLVLAAAALAVRVWIADRAPPGPLALIGLIVGLYALFRLAALTYITVFFGPFTGRMVFSTHATAVIVALPFLQETFAAWRGKQGASK